MGERQRRDRIWTGIYGANVRGWFARRAIWQLTARKDESWRQARSRILIRWADEARSRSSSVSVVANEAHDPTHNDSIRWVSDMPDTYLAGVFHWLREHGVKYGIVDDGRNLWLETGDEVRDGDWIVAAAFGSTTEEET